MSEPISPEPVSPEPGPTVIEQLTAALKATMPYALESARRHERMGLVEEAAAARDAHRRAQWALRAAGFGQPEPLFGIAGARDYED